VHQSVLAGPALEWLGVREDGVYVDCTAGAGGHSALIAQRLTCGRLLALDRDLSAVAIAGERLSAYPCAEVIHRNYGELAETLAEQRVELVDGVLIDAGLSSMQIDTPERGFSFQADGPLDMRMDPSRGEGAADYLKNVGEADLARALRQYGDVGPTKRIAAAICRRAGEGRLALTCDLVDAVSEALPFAKRIPDEVRQVFQAIRIAVNEELRWLEAGVRQAIDVLRPGGRIVVISFHSGEDRIAKNVLREESRVRRELELDGRVKRSIPPRLRVLTRKPVVPDEEENRLNPRAHSARLRAAERLATSED
jgi:16S rRNA (cytosine1402-N4)-methyltransferase